MPSEETVIQLPLSELHPFPNHPFKVRDDEAMRSMMESVSRYTPDRQVAMKSSPATGANMPAKRRGWR